MNTYENGHIPVMTQEMLSFFIGQQIKVFFDGTLGAGGHAQALLREHPEIESYLGCDRDPEAIDLARKNLLPWKNKVIFINGDFAALEDYLSERGITSVNGFFLI